MLSIQYGHRPEVEVGPEVQVILPEVNQGYWRRTIWIVWSIWIIWMDLLLWILDSGGFFAIFFVATLFQIELCFVLLFF